MYFDTPRDYIGSVYEALMFGDNPLGWETLGTKETIKGATRDTFTDYVDRWYTPDRMVVGVSGMVGDDLIPTLEGMLGEMPRTAGPARAGAARRRDGPHVRVHQKDSDQAQICVGVPSLRSSIPTATRCSCSRPCSARACRRASSSRCASGAASPTPSTARTTPTPTPARLLAGGCRPRAHRRRDQGDRRAVPAHGRRARAERRAGEGARVRQGPLRAPHREPAGPVMFGLRREVLEGRRSSRPDARRARQGHRRGRPARRAALIDAKALHLAVIGPFEDDERFVNLLS